VLEMVKRLNNMKDKEIFNEEEIAKMAKVASDTFWTRDWITEADAWPQVARAVAKEVLQIIIDRT
jgi:hypothetical protein